MDEINTIASRLLDSDDRFLHDESRLHGGNAERVFFPKNSLEISQLLRFCSIKKIPVTIYGLGTGITGAAVPFGGFVMSLEKIKKISDIKFDEKSRRSFLKSGASATLNEINEKINGSNLFYPVDPTEMSASIGGTVATNASGASSYKFGPTRKWVKALEIVLLDGSIHRIERNQIMADDSGFLEFAGNFFKVPDYKMPECKNAAGLFSSRNMDLIDFFIGSEGILGVISDVEIWLENKEPSISVIKFFPNEIQALEFVEAIKKDGIIKPDFIEYIDENGLEMLKRRILDDPNSVNMPEISTEKRTALFFDIKLDKNVPSDLFQTMNRIETDWSNSWCAWEKIEIERIKFFRHALPEAVNAHITNVQKKFPAIHKLGTDFAVPDKKFRELVDFYHFILDKSGLKYTAFGHIGDNHLHINILPENYDELERGKEIYAVIAKKAVEMKGTVSAEHGIGKIKHKYLEIMYGKNGINEMRRIKKVFDEYSLLNRNNMFAYEEQV